jgi:hypothetical protein
MPYAPKWWLQERERERERERLHVVIILECIPALHSRYLLVAASILCSVVRSLPCRACVPCIDIIHSYYDFSDD